MGNYRITINGYNLLDRAIFNDDIITLPKGNLRLGIKEVVRHLRAVGEYYFNVKNIEHKDWTTIKEECIGCCPIFEEDINEATISA